MESFEKGIATPLPVPKAPDPTWLRVVKFIFPIAIAVLVAIAIRAFVAEPIMVSGDSMDDTYKNGEYVILEKVTYYFRAPQRGDVVVCHYPDEYYEAGGRSANSWCVKRVIGVAGDTLQTKNGIVYLNGEPLDEPYLKKGTYTDGIQREITVPSGCVFVMGDNRFVSADSRMNEVGPIPLNRIKGKALW